MREIVELTTSVSSKDAPPGWQRLAYAFLQPLQPAEVNVSPFGLVIRFLFHRYSSQLEDVRVTLGRLGISTSMWVRREYEPDELLESEFLELRTELELNSVTDTLTWDLVPICPFCGFKETRWHLARIRIKRKPQGFQLANMDYHPKVVSAALADELRVAGFAGVELVPLEDNAPDWYALNAVHELPPIMSPPARLERLASATPTCERNHNLEVPNSEFFYRREGFLALDFNRTYEIFGDSEATGRAMIVSNRVYRLLVQLGVEHLTCEPARLLD